jgi:hypothetical protein
MAERTRRTLRSPLGDLLLVTIVVTVLATAAAYILVP